MNYSKRSLSIWHEKPHLAISVDELSGRDQMGQKKPFFKKIWGSHQKASKGQAQKFGLKLVELHMVMVITDPEQR